LPDGQNSDQNTIASLSNLGDRGGCMPARSFQGVALRRVEVESNDIESGADQAARECCAHQADSD
jgi:hypothetical protein